MERGETTSCLETDRKPLSRDHALALLPGTTRDEPDAPLRRCSGGRPMAPFVTQLILSADPTLRPERLERMRVAAARYATTGIALRRA